jgi:hypothetical protein
VHSTSTSFDYEQGTKKYKENRISPPQIWLLGCRRSSPLLSAPPASRRKAPAGVLDDRLMELPPGDGPVDELLPASVRWSSREGWSRRVEDLLDGEVWGRLRAHREVAGGGAHSAERWRCLEIGFAPGLYLRAGEKKCKENGSFASLGGGTNCNFMWKLTILELLSFLRREGFGWLL